MPRKSKLKLPALNLGKESLGQRVARLRKEKGYTQTQLADKIGLTQDLVSAYELDKLGMRAEMVIRFAQALEVSTDELLGVKSTKKKVDDEPSLRIMRRLNKIKTLPPSEQKTLLRTIDMLLKATEK